MLASQNKVSNSTDSELHHAMEMVMLDARELSDEFQSGAFGNVAEPLRGVRCAQRRWGWKPQARHCADVVANSAEAAKRKRASGTGAAAPRSNKVNLQVDGAVGRLLVSVQAHSLLGLRTLK